MADLAQATAKSVHSDLKGNVYLQAGKAWCPDCNQLCPCSCCGPAVAAALAEEAAPTVRQLPHIAGVEYRSSG